MQKMRNQIRRRSLLLLAVTLSLTLLIDGPLWPVMVFASLDDEETPEQVSQTNIQAGTSDPYTSKYQGQIDAITNKKKELELEKAVIENNISSAKSAKDKEIANKNYIDRQIAITESEIELLYERISILEQDIEEKIEDIDQKELEYKSNYSQFLKRLRSMQLNGEASQFGAILGADDFADYLATNEMMSRITEYDKNLMVRVKEERIQLEEERAELEHTMLLVEDDRAEAEAKKKTLNSQRQSAVLKIQDIDEMEQQFKADLVQNQKLQKEMQSELDNIYKQIEWEKSPYVGGQMEWPVPGYTNITSQYGPRWANTDYHTGIDISGSGVYGKPIVAANNGTVAYVNTSYVAGRGYGIYLLIDHGGTISTLYGHCSRVVVSVGDKVTRGQKIAEIGSTGWSTGPHLHFEVRVNGQHTPPLPYLTR